MNVHLSFILHILYLGWSLNENCMKPQQHKLDISHHVRIKALLREILPALPSEENEEQSNGASSTISHDKQ